MARYLGVDDDQASERILIGTTIRSNKSPKHSKEPPINATYLHFIIMRSFLISLALFVASTDITNQVAAFSPPSLLASPPILGIGAILFKPNVKIVKSGDAGGEGDDALTKAGKFFVEAFW
jgi:hypothetical protein